MTLLLLKEKCLILLEKLAKLENTQFEPLSTKTYSPVHILGSKTKNQKAFNKYFIFVELIKLLDNTLAISPSSTLISVYVSVIYQFVNFFEQFFLLGTGKKLEVICAESGIAKEKVVIGPVSSRIVSLERRILHELYLKASDDVENEKAIQRELRNNNDAGDINEIKGEIEDLDLGLEEEVNEQNLTGSISAIKYAKKIYSNLMAKRERLDFERLLCGDSEAVKEVLDIEKAVTKVQSKVRERNARKVVDEIRCEENKLCGLNISSYIHSKEHQQLAFDKNNGINEIYVDLLILNNTFDSLSLMRQIQYGNNIVDTKNRLSMVTSLLASHTEAIQLMKELLMISGVVLKPGQDIIRFDFLTSYEVTIKVADKKKTVTQKSVIFPHAITSWQIDKKIDKNVILLVGENGSGRRTWTKSLIEKVGGAMITVNRLLFQSKLIKRTKLMTLITRLCRCDSYVVVVFEKLDIFKKQKKGNPIKHSIYQLLMALKQIPGVLIIGHANSVNQLHENILNSFTHCVFLRPLNTTEQYDLVGTEMCSKHSPSIDSQKNVDTYLNFPDLSKKVGRKARPRDLIKGLEGSTKKQAPSDR
uniref:ATPase_AAA_core domain-containing protein n=1 Tax=Rhabditophanes sp. KR3021 TaxID=114890 RepID=A0AC35TNQ1_9BILA